MSFLGELYQRIRDSWSVSATEEVRPTPFNLFGWSIMMPYVICERLDFKIIIGTETAAKFEFLRSLVPMTDTELDSAFMSRSQPKDVGLEVIK